MNQEEVNDVKVIAAAVEEKQTEMAQSETIKKQVHKPVDPTRYGDWEKNGRCIDF